MGFLHKLFHRPTAQERYATVIQMTVARLDPLNTYMPILTSPCDYRVFEEINHISSKDAEYYHKANFLGALLHAIGHISRKAFWAYDKANLESIRAGGKPVGEAKVLEKTMNAQDPEWQELLATNCGLAVGMLAHDPDVDLKVAQDLGRGANYPLRPALPQDPNANKDQLYAIGFQRVWLFWKTVLGFPIPFMLAILAGKVEVKPKPSTRRPAVESVRCSGCTKELKRLDVGIAENIPYLQQWSGNVCLRCRRIYCSNCLQLGGPTPCPVCSEPTKPAQRLHLWEIGVFEQPMPAPAPKSAAAPGPRKSKLPVIGPEFLNTEFVPAEEAAGAGGAAFREAIEWSKQEESDKEEEALKQAVVAGLPPTCESYANCQLGILALRKGQIDRGVDYLLRCLGAETKSANSAWDAAARLQVIYAEEGRLEEAEAVGKVAVSANTRGLELTGEAEQALRELVRSGPW